MCAEFWDADGGAFFFTGRSHERLVARTKEYFDNATPSGNSTAAGLLTHLGTLLDRDDFRAKASTIASNVSDYLVRFPTGFGRMLGAVDLQLGPSREIAIIGAAGPFLDVVRSRYLPRTVIAAGEGSAVALLRDRVAVDGKPTAYVCENYSCRTPATDPRDLAAQLESPWSGKS
jgi:hypothetical protein